MDTKKFPPTKIAPIGETPEMLAAITICDAAKGNASSADALDAIHSLNLKPELSAALGYLLGTMTGMYIGQQQAIAMWQEIARTEQRRAADPFLQTR